MPFHELDIQRDDATPMYMRLAGAIRNQVKDGSLQIGEALPPERELGEMTGVSRVTVRKAIELLMKEGMLSRRQGSGTYVAPHIEQPSSVLTGFSADMGNRGWQPGSQWIQRKTGTPSPEEALALGLNMGQQIHRLERLRTADGEALAIELAVIPVLFLPDLSLIDTSLYTALESLGNKPVSGLQRITASLSTQKEAKLLDIASGAAVLRIERRGYLPDGRCVEFTRSAYRGDRYDFLSELRISGQAKSGSTDETIVD
jgi:GntR family transcriptional regulator